MQALEDQTVGVSVTCCKTFSGKRLFRSREVKKEKVEKIYAKPFRCDFLLLHYILVRGKLFDVAFFGFCMLSIRLTNNKPFKHLCNFDVNKSNTRPFP